MNMHTVYLVCLALGLGLPLLNVLVGGITEALDIDFDLDLDGFAVSDFIPLRPMCILLFLLVFGGLGLFTIDVMALWASILISGVSGWIAAMLLNKFVIKPLKKNRCDAISIDNLIGLKSRLTVRLSPGGTGAMLLELPQGLIAYSVKENTPLSSTLEVGTEVVVTGYTPNHSALLVEPVEKQIEKEDETSGLKGMTL